MRRRGSGVLAFVSSMGGRTMLPSIPHYCASKGALEMMAEGYRNDLASLGIDVVILEPGFFNTRVMHNIRAIGRAQPRAHPLGARGGSWLQDRTAPAGLSAEAYAKNTALFLHARRERRADGRPRRVARPRALERVRRRRVHRLP